MRHSIKLLLAVVLTVMSFSVVQTVWAGGPEPTEWLTISGTINQIYPEDSTIVIISYKDNLPYTITGFPFGYLENELDITIKENDCVTVDYAVVLCKTGTKNIAVALTGYCEVCPEILAEIVESCSVDSIVLRDDDFYPVDKSRNDDDDDHYHHQNRPGNGS